MKNKKIIITLFLFVIMISMFQHTYATSFLENIFSQGKSFFDSQTLPGGTAGDIGLKLRQAVRDLGLIDAIRAIGYLIFAIITVVLGVRYIWSGVEGKTVIKNTLPQFAVAVVFFYLADTLYKFFDVGISYAIFNTGGTYQAFSQSAVGTIYSVINVLAIAGVIFIGLLYLFASPDKKADIKDNLLPLVIGLVFVYCASQVVTFIISIGSVIS